ncbi:unnamed protein product [Prorocentrum cordatum]|uniref:Uncharacterized protein n=1 Tax=Prorocentrum cordatum TaxID=2364126 RepID=A0ABN9WQS0_9DINO|nr:unnamed protein product [Polarella glacialis]
MTRLLALARGDDTTTRELLFGVRIPKPPEGEQGRLWLGSVWLDISALKSEAAMVGVPAAKLVKWLAAAAAPEADELPGLLYYALCLLSCGTLAGSLCFGWAACAATWSTGGTGVAPQELPLESSSARDWTASRRQRVPSSTRSYHDYYMAEYRQQLAQAAMMDNTNGTRLLVQPRGAVGDVPGVSCRVRRGGSQALRHRPRHLLEHWMGPRPQAHLLA